MDRYAIFVDAGYFFAAGAQSGSLALKPPKITRKQVSLKSPDAALANICRVASAISEDMPLLPEPIGTMPHPGPECPLSSLP